MLSLSYIALNQVVFGGSSPVFTCFASSLSAFFQSGSSSRPFMLMGPDVLMTRHSSACAGTRDIKASMTRIIFVFVVTPLKGQLFHHMPRSGCTPSKFFCRLHCYFYELSGLAGFPGFKADESGEYAILDVRSRLLAVAHCHQEIVLELLVSAAVADLARPKGAP